MRPVRMLRVRQTPDGGALAGFSGVTVKKFSEHQHRRRGLADAAAVAVEIRVGDRAVLIDLQLHAHHVVEVSDD